MPLGPLCPLPGTPFPSVQSQPSSRPPQTPPVVRSCLGLALPGQEASVLCWDTVVLSSGLWVSGVCPVDPGQEELCPGRQCPWVPVVSAGPAQGRQLEGRVEGREGGTGSLGPGLRAPFWRAKRRPKSHVMRVSDAPHAPPPAGSGQVPGPEPSTSHPAKSPASPAALGRRCYLSLFLVYL